jgi:hypothetical protein
MSGFVLKKGTVVSHGTSLARLQSIMDHGLLAGVESAEGRKMSELAPESKGVYVGELMAYFGAYAQYSAEVAPHLEHPEVTKAGWLFGMGDVRSLRAAALPAAPLTFPVVLKIRLDEDCELLADEDFVADGQWPVQEKVPVALLREEAEQIWERWATGVLTRDIPATWIVSVEHPRVTTLDKLQQSEGQVFADCELFAGGMMQSFKREDPATLIPAYVKRHGKLALSQSMPFTMQAIVRLRGFNGFSDNASRYANHFRLFQMIDMLSKEYEIPVVRNFGERLLLDRNGYAG